MIISKELKKGTMVRMNNELWICMESNHHKPGKGHAMVRAKLRNVRKGGTSDFTFSTDEKLDDVSLERINASFLYIEGDNYVFMATDTYEQEPVAKEVLGDSIYFLQEGMEVILDKFEEEILNVQLPNHVELEVTYTEPGLAGDTVGNTTKPAEVESGYELQVPLFVKTGDKIRIDTRTGSYVERV